MRLSSQLPPCSATAWATDSTRPVRSGPMMVITTGTCMRKSRLAGDLAPVHTLRAGVELKSFFVLDQYRAHDAGIVRAAEFQDAVGNEAHFLVRVEQRKYRLGQRIE